MYHYRYTITVPAPIKDAASIQKLFFSGLHYVAFRQMLSILYSIAQKSIKRTILNNFHSAVTIQERPLLTQVQ